VTAVPLRRNRDFLLLQAGQLLFAAFGLTLALWGSLSPSIRAAPGLEELGTGG
jgi:hypothetical protein